MKTNSKKTVFSSKNKNPDSFKQKFESRIFYSPDGCWYWIGTCFKNSAYGRIGFSKISLLAHRAAYELYIGVIPTNLLVCHTCDNPLCVNPDHLWLGTPADNMKDKCSKGRQSIPASVPIKLNKADALNVLSLVGNISDKEIASRYGVTKDLIGLVRRGKVWKDLINENVCTKQQ